MIRNDTRDTVLAERTWLATGMFFRMRGMLRRQFHDFDAMVFPRCGSIHMWCMHMPLDIVFIDADDRVVGLRPELPPWAMARQRGARTTVELPAGVIAASSTEVGDQLVLSGMLRNGRPG
jgi:uncharacterized membrane protein (UPF0127 family)